MQKYLVGGAVRDQLLGLAPKERDWVVIGSTPEEMQRLGFTPVGKDFPVFLHPETHEEYALARTERKSGRGYKGFTFYYDANVRLEDDLKRRDLTINAMAQDLETGHIIDPFNGQNDLKNRILRHVSEAFIEDPLRILRVARFSALLSSFSFQIAEDTRKLLKEMVAQGELNDLVPERVWKEVERALMTPKPSIFFQTLYELGALSVLFPEVEVLFNTHADQKVMDALDRAAQINTEGSIRFAILLHRLDETDPQHSQQLIQNFCMRLRVPNRYRELAEITARYTVIIPKLDLTSAEELLNVLERVDSLRRPERFEQFLVATKMVYVSSDIELKIALLKAAQSYLSQLRIPPELLTPSSKENPIAQKIHEYRRQSLQEWLDNLNYDILRSKQSPP